MSRRRKNDTGSLDLLLDTICNTFGGILLIALLVIVLLNTTSKTKAVGDTEKSQLEMLDNAIKQEEPGREIERLR